MYSSFVVLENKVKKFVCIIIVLLFTLTACGKEEIKPQIFSESERDIETFENSIEDNAVTIENIETYDVFNSLVQVQIDTRMGSGILWKKQEGMWIFVTASHVVEGAEQAEIYFVAEDKMYVAQVNCVAGLDLAFLCVDSQTFTQDVLEKYEEVCDKTALPEYNASITAVGYDALGEQKAYEGIVEETWIYVEDFQNYMVLSRCNALPGMSGGGIFDLDGHLNALICGQDEEGMVACLSATVLESEYQMFINN